MSILKITFSFIAYCINKPVLRYLKEHLQGKKNFQYLSFSDYMRKLEQIEALEKEIEERNQQTK